MIINLRGNHASGKSTTVRNVLKHYKSTPIYGLLGPKQPEAYHCETAPGLPSLHILGPYINPTTAGCDFVTKRGMAVMIALMEKYASKGNVLFESILTSVRFGAPGDWLEAHKDEVLVVILDVSLEECIKSLHARQADSNFAGGEKHIRDHQHQFERIQVRLKEKGFHVEHVNRENAVDRIIQWLT